jgi:hypothetical protein
MSISDLELYENNYYCFYKTLETVVQTPEDCCRIMGYYNVAWEILDDLRASKYLSMT